MKLAEAKQIANSLVERMRPYCEQIQIAGSIRRGKLECKDIEIVACPKWENQLTEPGNGNLFGEVVLANLLYEAIKDSIRWIKPGVSEIIDWPIKPDGKYWRALIPIDVALCADKNCGAPLRPTCTRPHSQPENHGVKLDCFLCNTSNFGLLLMIRTGPDTFSKELVTQQYKGGLLPNKYKVSRGQLWEVDLDNEIPVETPTEQSVFDILGIPFIPPEERK